MTFFWDRNLGLSIPKAIKMLHPPFDNEVHHDYFPESDRIGENGDDSWLPLLGDRGWFLLTQDYRLHHRTSEAASLRRHRIGCFYLWGANAKRWDIARCFMTAAPAIIEAAQLTTRPFIFRVDRSGNLNSVPLP